MQAARALPWPAVTIAGTRLPSIRAAAAFLLGALPASFGWVWWATPEPPDRLPWRRLVTFITAFLLCGVPVLLYGVLAQLWRHRMRLEGARLFWSCVLPGFFLYSLCWLLWTSRYDASTIALVLGVGAALAAHLLPVFHPRRSPLPEHGAVASRMPAALPLAAVTRAGAGPRARRADEAAAYGVILGYGLLAVFALDSLLFSLADGGLEAMEGFAVYGILLGLPSFLVIGFALATAAGLLFFAGDTLGALLRPRVAPPVPYGLISATLSIVLAWQLWPDGERLLARGWQVLLLPFLVGLLGTLLAPRAR